MVAFDLRRGNNMRRWPAACEGQDGEVGLPWLANAHQVRHIGALVRLGIVVEWGIAV